MQDLTFPRTLKRCIKSTEKKNFREPHKLAATGSFLNKERMVDFMKWYRAEIEDDNFEMILADNEEDAINQYFELGEKHDLFNLIELDDDNNEVRTIL